VPSFEVVLECINENNIYSCILLLFLLPLACHAECGKGKSLNLVYAYLHKQWMCTLFIYREENLSQSRQIKLYMLIYVCDVHHVKIEEKVSSASHSASC
jgi:hypothetical protein